jgi:hypothetical protein
MGELIGYQNEKRTICKSQIVRFSLSTVNCTLVNSNFFL